MKKTNKRSGPSSAKSTKLLSVVKAPALIDEATLLSDLLTLIQSARQRIATVANSAPYAALLAGREPPAQGESSARTSSLRQTDSCDRVARIDSGVRRWVQPAKTLTTGERTIVEPQAVFFVVDCD